MMVSRRLSPSGRWSTLMWLWVLAVLAVPGVSQAQDVPLPEESIGFAPGENYRLADYEQLKAYYEAVAEASDRVELEVIGQTHQGRDLLLLHISSPENLQNLEHYRSISQRLAMARELDDDAARELASEGKAVVWIDHGLHSAERAHSQAGPHLAYHLATDQSRETQRILDDVILLMMPLMNPDGHTVVVDWYREQRGTPFEETDPPRVWHEYIDHDNNRDWYMLLQNESQAVAEVIYNSWHPQIVLNHHQMGESPVRMFIPPFDEPVNPHIPAMAVRGTNLVGEHMANRFAGEGKAGIQQRSGFDMWWNGGMRTAPYFHNMVGILTESTHRSPVPRYWEREEITGTQIIGGQEQPYDEPSVFYPDPWMGGWSTLMQMVEYHHTASMGVLDVASLRREDWLYNKYQMGRDAIAAGEAGSPFAYVVPEDQWDGPEAVEMLRVLDRGGIEIHRATSAFTADGTAYDAGSFILYAGQAYRAHLRDLMEPQNYPERTQYPGGPPDPPYDMAGWTLPIQMGVESHIIEEPFQANVERLEEVPTPPARVANAGSSHYLLDARSNFAARAVNRLLGEGHEMARTGEAFTQGGASFTKGTFVIASRGEMTTDLLGELRQQLGLDFHGVDTLPGVESHPLSQPRMAKYRSWVKNIDGGWTRWVFDEYGFDYDEVYDAGIRGGALAEYDVLILPAAPARNLLRGHDEGTMPDAYVGGLGTEGASQIKEFVQAGGTVVAWDGSTDFLIEQLGLPVRNRVEQAGRDNFFIPGSLLNLDVETDHPVTYGMQERVGAWFVERRGSQSRSFEVVRPAEVDDAYAEERRRADAPRVQVVARFAEDDLLASGWARGEDRFLAGHPAVVRVGLGEGDIVLIGVRPQFRGQPRSTMKLVFNSIYMSGMEGLLQVDRVAIPEE